jgi:hypothetical protein
VRSEWISFHRNAVSPIGATAVLACSPPSAAARVLPGATFKAVQSRDCSGANLDKSAGREPIKDPAHRCRVVDRRSQRKPVVVHNLLQRLGLALQQGCNIRRAILDQIIALAPSDQAIERIVRHEAHFDWKAGARANVVESGVKGPRATPGCSNGFTGRVAWTILRRSSKKKTPSTPWRAGRARRGPGVPKDSGGFEWLRLGAVALPDQTQSCETDQEKDQRARLGCCDRRHRDVAKIGLGAYVT